MWLPDYESTVHLDSQGEITQKRWVGEFTVKNVLSHADRFAVERMYKKLLPNDESVPEKVTSNAALIAELSVRVVKGPEWWTSTKFGQLMVDEQPLVDLLIKCSESADEWNKRLSEISKEEGDSVAESEKQDQ